MVWAWASSRLAPSRPRTAGREALSCLSTRAAIGCTSRPDYCAVAAAAWGGQCERCCVHRQRHRGRRQQHASALEVAAGQVYEGGCDATPPGQQCLACPQGVGSDALGAGEECHPQLELLVGATPGFVDGMGIRARFYRPSGVAVEDITRRIYVADSYNHRIRVLDMEDLIEEVEVYVEQWYEVLVRALRENLFFTVILIASLIIVCCCTYACCRFCTLCPLYQRKLHAKRMTSMEIGNRA